MRLSLEKLPIGYRAPISVAVLALVHAASYDAHEPCRETLGALSQSSSFAPAGAYSVTCNLAQGGVLRNFVLLPPAR